MLKINDISKVFKDTTALNRVSFEVKEKGVVGLLGPNGAGKTTLMRIITGFYTPTEGNIEWKDLKIDPKSTSFREIIGYLPESNPLYVYMTVLEYLRYIADIKGLKDMNLVCESAKKCGLEKVWKQKIETLSKGYKQRVGLAAAILGEPKILILDEPTSGLDPNQIIEIRKLIKELSKNKLVILSTHILPEAKEICDRLLLINRGKLVLDEETKKIKNLEKKFVELTS